MLVIEDGKTYGVKAEGPGWMGDDNDGDHGNVSEVFNTSSTRQLRQSLPREVFVTTTLAYDNSLLQAFNFNYYAMESHILKIAYLAKLLMRLLDVKVNLRFRGLEYFNEWISPSPHWMEVLRWQNEGKWKEGPISLFVAQRGMYDI